MAIEAAAEAERRYMETRGEQQHVLELELQQARYAAALAERRYAACDPDNRLIAAQLDGVTPRRGLPGAAGGGAVAGSRRRPARLHRPGGRSRMLPGTRQG